MLHRHEHHRPLTEAERALLLSEGAVIQGMVAHCEPSPADRTLTVVRVSVNFKDNQSAEFTEELASLYQPAPGSPDARRLAEVRGAQQVRHPDRIPKIQLPLFAGTRVPVRYDSADRTRLTLDIPALRKRALHDYLQREQRAGEQPPARPRAAAGPPWTVPAHCPNCGAPVDQAKASRADDPQCQFCHQPVPVEPARV